MSVDLTILPALTSLSKLDNISIDVLKFDSDPDLFQEIINLSKDKGVDVQRHGISSHLSSGELGESCWGPTETDRYDKRIKSVLAWELAHLLNSFVAENSGWRNNAIRAYVNALPAELPIYLYWS